MPTTEARVNRVRLPARTSRLKREVKGGKRKIMHRNMSEKDMCKHVKSKGSAMILLGILVLLNAYFMMFDWPNFIALLLILVGLKKLIWCC